MTQGPALPLDELYRDLILEHYRKPRNHGTLPSPTFRLEGVNPTCGDEIRLDVEMDGDTIKAAAFEGVGCAISQASASMMTETVVGLDTAAAKAIASDFRAMLVEGAEPSERIGDLESLQGVAKFHGRVKCGLLSWEVLKGAMG